MEKPCKFSRDIQMSGFHMFPMAEGKNSWIYNIAAV